MGDWSRYPYADNVVQVLAEHQEVSLSVGQSAYFVNLLMARPEEQASDLRIKRLGEGVALLEGEGERVVVGVAPEGRPVDEVKLNAAIFEFNPMAVAAMS